MRRQTVTTGVVLCLLLLVAGFPGGVAVAEPGDSELSDAESNRPDGPTAGDLTRLPPLTESQKTLIVTLTDSSNLDPADPLYPFMRYVDTLRDRAQEALDAAEAAEEQSRVAREAYEKARFEATIAGVRAEHARGMVNRWAAGVYRNDTNVDEYVNIINTALTDPSRSLDVREWLSQVSGHRQAQAALARAAEYAADQAQQRAAGIALEVDILTREALERRAQATNALIAVESELENLLGQAVSYQLVIGVDGCPVSVPTGTLRGAARNMDVAALCAENVSRARTPEAALAIKYAFRALGADYACGGLGRNEPFRYDCSSLVSRAYEDGAGLPLRARGYTPSTRDLLPWGGRDRVTWSVPVEVVDAMPGDLVFYDTGHADSRHVLMLLSGGLMLHVGACGDVVNVTNAWPFADGDGYTFLGIRRVDPDAARAAADPTGPALELDDPSLWLGDGVDGTETAGNLDLRRVATRSIRQ